MILLDFYFLRTAVLLISNISSHACFMQHRGMDQRPVALKVALQLQKYSRSGSDQPSKRVFCRRQHSEQFLLALNSECPERREGVGKEITTVPIG